MLAIALVAGPAGAAEQNPCDPFDQNPHIECRVKVTPQTGANGAYADIEIQLYFQNGNDAPFLDVEEDFGWFGAGYGLGTPVDVDAYPKVGSEQVIGYCEYGIPVVGGCVPEAWAPTVDIVYHGFEFTDIPVYLSSGDSTPGGDRPDMTIHGACNRPPESGTDCDGAELRLFSVSFDD